MKTLLTLAALGLGIGAFATADIARADHFSNRRFNQYASHHGHYNQFGHGSFHQGHFGGHGYGHGYGNGYGNGFGNGYGNRYGNGRGYGYGGFGSGYAGRGFQGQRSGFHMSFNLFR
jgi:hypothetical protein